MVTYAALRVESGQSLPPPNKRIPANNPLGIPVSWYGTMLGPNAVSRTLPQITLDRVWSVTPRLKILYTYITLLPSAGGCAVLTVHLIYRLPGG